MRMYASLEDVYSKFANMIGDLALQINAASFLCASLHSMDRFGKASLTDAMFHRSLIANCVQEVSAGCRHNVHTYHNL